ncbi:MAG: TRAP transporter substrate-binding protein DctP [Lachnospiraceae bacterium]|jgi:tripartite ATP-independent transporter DctP family solute receptor|nr:TRAP transporter substrate-binding protein DctP [Lachnospiraceae bacterium]
MKKKLFTTLLSAALTAVLLTGCGSKQEDTPKIDDQKAEEQPSENTEQKEAPAKEGETYVIKLGMTQGDVPREESAEVTWTERFKEEVEANSNGRITVEIYPSGQLGSVEENLSGLLNGSLEMTVANINSLNNIYGDTMVFSCPALFRNEAQCDAVLAGEWGQSFFTSVGEKSGIHVLAAFCNGMRCFTSTNKELTTVDTAKGVTFRVMQSEVCEKMVEAIGANPVPMAGSEMYTALQNGTVDGQENPPVNILNDKTYEVQKYMVMDKHIASIVTFAVSESFLNGLPEDLKQVVIDAANKVTPEASAVCARLNEEGVAKLEEYGMTVYTPTDEELEDWHEAMRQPCIDFVTEQVGSELVEELLAAIEGA